jgi:uncharacterized protein (DUF433 family)
MNKTIKKMKYPLIVSNIEILGGKPCIKGTRISVELITESLNAETKISDLLEKYPHLIIEGINQASSFPKK